MRKKIEYTSYLKLDDVLSQQNLESKEQSGKSAHEEMLFIITHQTYELWFKQILWEIDSIIEMLEPDYVKEQDLSVCVHRLKRINEIWKILISQITVLETMTSLEFLEFRNFLYPASGFQSFQFRLIENKLGLKATERKPLGSSGCPYHQFISEDKQETVLKSEENKSVLASVESWLSRTPYLKTEGYDFWSEYQKSVQKMFNNERELINNSSLPESEKNSSVESINTSEENFNEFFDKNKFKENKNWKLSYKALHAALFIQLYRHEPQLRTAFNLIEELINLDEHMTLWRTRHAQMALRMLGQKVGTGGSSGEKYLNEAANSHKIFDDFFKLATFFIDAKDLKSPDL